MNELMNFNYNGNETRVIEKDGQIWWVLKDVCDVLGLENARRVADRMDEDELTLLKVTSGGQLRDMNCVNEAGLYNVILRSDKPEAKGFKRWVTHDVLPSIRKTGQYKTPQRDEAERKMLAEAKLKNAKAREAAMWLKISKEIESNTYRQICASYASEALTGGVRIIPLPASSAKHYSAGEIGAMLGVSGNRIGRLSNEYGLKTDEFGVWFHDKSAHSAKEVESFRYNEKAIAKFKTILQ